MEEKNVLRSLERFDELFKDAFQWLAGQYDHDSGGFYFARSAIGNPELAPNIETTASALGVIDRCGLLDSMPKHVKEKMISFFQSRQDPDTGYFYDPHNGMRTIERLVSRALAYSIASLKRLGAKPLYPVPGSSSSINSLPEYLDTPGRYGEWAENLDWSNGWVAADRISASHIYMLNMPEDKREPYLKTIWDFAEERQAADTGLWGEGSLYERVSGAFKLAIYYGAFAKPMPQAAKIFFSTLKCMKEEPAEDLMFVKNPLQLLANLKPQIEELVHANIVEIVDITVQNLKAFKRDDGGFSRMTYGSVAAPNNGIRLGMGLKESDSCLSGALKSRKFCYKLAGIEERTMSEYTKGFYDMLGRT